MLITVADRKAKIAAVFAALIIFASANMAVARETIWGGVHDREVGIGGNRITPGGRPEEPPAQENIISGKKNQGAVKVDPYEYFAHFGCPLPGKHENGDACKLNRSCAIDAKHDGIIHYVYRRLKTGGKWQRTGTSYCAAPGSQSPEDAEKRVADPEPVVTQEEFQKMPIKPMGVVLQPGVNTLKNYNTNVYLSGGPQVLNTEILGRPVRVRATPVSYVYDYGDGIRKGPLKDKGKALSQDAWDVETSTSHRYVSTGKFSVVVTTVYSGEFSVAGGDWQPIDGTASIASDPQALTVWKTRSGWVQDGCSEKPSGWGC